MYADLIVNGKICELEACFSGPNIEPERSSSPDSGYILYYFSAWLGEFVVVLFIICFLNLILGSVFGKVNFNFGTDIVSLNTGPKNYF